MKGTQMARDARSARTPAMRLGIVAALLLGALSIVLGVAPAQAAGVVNATIHVPANVTTNPCFPKDVVDLSGDFHVVITTTTDHRGGYHTTTSINSQLSGASITTRTKYVNSETQNEDWYGRAPFPAVHTEVHNFILVSNNGTPNYLLYVTMHTTVTAGGVPTAFVDNIRMDCQG
jgi:hypothetical protein